MNTWFFSLENLDILPTGIKMDNIQQLDRLREAFQCFEDVVNNLLRERPRGLSMQTLSGLECWEHEESRVLSSDSANT